MQPLTRDRVIPLLLLHNVRTFSEDEGEQLAYCLPPLRAGLSSFVDFPGPFAYVGRETRWKASHDCDVEECRGVDEVLP